MSNPVIEKIKHKLIVSCQAEENTPFDSPADMLKFAQAAVLGGAGGIRSEGFEKTRLIRKHIELPLIGLVKGKFTDGFVRITREFKEVEDILDAGADIVAIDGTKRIHNKISGPALIETCKKKMPGIVILADISTTDDAKASIESGADAISTCLRGFTPETHDAVNGNLDLDFLERLLIMFPGFPVVAEGLITTPESAGTVIRMGAWSVVIGSAITRPHVVTSWFGNAINKNL